MMSLKRKGNQRGGQNHKNKIMKKIISILSLLALISCGNSTPDESDAKEAARAAIIQSLKDPNSAKFHHNEIINDLGDNTFQYTETIGATNSFGGVITQNAIVKVKWLKDDPSEVTNWSVVNLQFNER